MPIQGLTQVRRLPRLGKIKMGVKVKAKTRDGREIEIPQKTDHFVVPPEVEKIYGKEPKVLDILIPVEDEEKWAPQYYKLYSRTQGLVCKGDGCNAQRLFDTATGERAHKTTTEIVRRDYDCAGRKCPDYLAKDACKEVMTLMFILYKVPGMGIWQIDTSSINSIININSCADYIRAVFGKVSWIPLQLTIEPKEVQNPESGKRQTVYVLNIRNNLVLLDMVEATKKFQAQLPENTRLLLPAADDTAVEAEELVEDGQEPDSDPEPEPTMETHESGQKQTESDIMFDSLVSATVEKSKVDADWVKNTIFNLRQNGCEEVTANKLADRWKNKYSVKESLEGLNFKQSLAMLLPTDAEDFCKWLQELEDKYPAKASTVTTQISTNVESEKETKSNIPANAGDLCTWAYRHGKTYNMTWVCRQLKVNQPEQIKDIAKAYADIKEFTGWTD
jgi:hypothetical protein